MLMSAKFKQVPLLDDGYIFYRQGIVDRMILPKELKDRLLYDAIIDENNHIRLIEGDKVYILTDRFGIVKDTMDVEANIFFVDGGIVFELLGGSLALEADNGQVIIVDEFGDIRYPSSSTRIYWYDYNSFLENAEVLTKYKYGLEGLDNLVSDYVNNLVYNISMSYANDTKSGYIATIKFQGYYHDLGLDKFPFFDMRNYDPEPEEEIDHKDIADLEIPDEEDFEEEIEDLSEEFESII